MTRGAIVDEHAQPHGAAGFNEFTDTDPDRLLA